MITIIPAIDIIDGECVRLTCGDYNAKSSYYKDPLEVALKYEDCGLKRLHLVDLDGAKAQQPKNLKVLERIASSTSLELQYGGGIKSDEALSSVFDAGAMRAICGSIAVKEPQKFEQWLTKFGAEHIILGADTRDGKIAINGWLESSEVGVEELISRFAGFGLSQVICTDIAKDGMLQGPSTELYVYLQNIFPDIDITVSGGLDLVRIH
ncbi:MAG: HisA/HisF-related TIM barrel protein, partial [Rikenellaceae bacterium]